LCSGCAGTDGTAANQHKSLLKRHEIFLAMPPGSRYYSFNFEICILYGNFFPPPRHKDTKDLI
jgi:hypothetical protein